MHTLITSFVVAETETGPTDLHQEQHQVIASHKSPPTLITTFVVTQQGRQLNFTKNNIDITANTPEVGEAKESLPVTYKGRDFSIAFNPEFFMAPLRALSEDEVFLDLIDEMSPGVLKIQTPFLYVLMPMRISS